LTAHRESDRARDLAAVVALVSALAAPSMLAQQTGPKNVADTACRPAALHDYCRVGCSEPRHAVETHHVEPTLTPVPGPPPSGVAILEVGVDLNGKVVSACIMRGVRDDFDKAAQAAALASQWKMPVPHVRVRGYVLTVTACTPDRSSDCARRPSK
jgi:hypothetical protein